MTDENVIMIKFHDEDEGKAVSFEPLGEIVTEDKDFPYNQLVAMATLTLLKDEERLQEMVDDFLKKAEDGDFDNE